MRGESETPEVGRGASPASRFSCYTSRSSISAPASMIAVYRGAASLPIRSEMSRLVATTSPSGMTTRRRRRSAADGGFGRRGGGGGVGIVGGAQLHVEESRAFCLTEGEVVAS